MQEVIGVTSKPFLSLGFGDKYFQIINHNGCGGYFKSLETILFEVFLDVGWVLNCCALSLLILTMHVLAQLDFGISIWVATVTVAKESKTQMLTLQKVNTILITQTRNLCM